MLEILKREELEQYIELAYLLSQDITKSSYPSFLDGIKSKEYFINMTSFAFVSENEKILIYKENNQFLGWIQYYYDEEEGRISTYTCLCLCSCQKMLEEFIIYIQDKYPSAVIAMGFPVENVSACETLIRQGFQLEENSYNNVINLRDYQISSHSKVVRKIAKEEFDLFRVIHDSIDIDMYWNSDRIYDDFESWSIYIYEENGLVKGAIYCLDEKILLEVFGIDYKNNTVIKEVYENLLIVLLNDAKNNGVIHVVYFSESSEEVKFLNQIGFKFVGEYKYFTKKLRDNQ